MTLTPGDRTIKDAKMWGARARAAEYNAYTAAARRVSDEDKVPQKSAPVSLGAFTKNPPLNRNKGTKTWKPLVLEDTPEPDDKDTDDHQGKLSTPTRVKSVDRRKFENNVSDLALPTESLRASLSAGHTPELIAPTAPRAMLKMSQTPSTLINPTPKRVQPHAIIDQSQQGQTSSMQCSPGRFTGTGGYPCPSPYYPRLTSWYNSQGLPLTGSAPTSIAPAVKNPMLPFYGHVMVPDDISPTKQENKLASMSQANTGPIARFANAQSQFILGAGSGMNSVPHLGPGLHISTGYDNRYGNGLYQAGVTFTVPPNRPILPHVSSEGAIDNDGSHSDESYLAAPDIARPSCYPDAAAAAISNTSIVTPQRSRIPIVQSSEEERYDRQTKMQTFVAAQQALARTGKTVLHNPDLHRVKASETTSPNHSGSTETTPEHTTRTQTLPQGHLTILKPPPGFGAQALLPHQTLEDVNESKSSPIDQATLRNMFEVGSDDWLQLKPVTSKERAKMQKVMRTFARAQAPDEPRGFAQETSSETKKENLKNWMHVANKDNKPATATLRLFEEAAEERLSKKDAVFGDGNGLSQAEMDCAAICAVGDIVASLKDDAAGSGAVIGADAIFPKYKPAPEYAIERGQALTGNTGNTSFFEGKSGGFYTAPSRIARDPRFRPAGKEATPIKQEDSWKLRGDMYGRRRV